MLDLQKLRYFVEVARHRHFSKAAEVCHVAQPSLSQQIKKLEESAGGSLLVRNRRAISLTPLGESLLRHAQNILSEVDRAENFLLEAQGRARRTIRLGAIPTIAPYLLPRLVEHLRHLLPEAEFALEENRTEALVENLLAGSMDYALLSPPTAADEFCEAFDLPGDPLYLTLPTNHPLAKQKTIAPPELAGENILLLERSHCLHGQTAAYCEQIGLNTSINIQGSQIETLIRLVEQGLGLTFTPGLAVSTYTDRKVVFRPLTDPPCQRKIQLVWPRSPISPSVHEWILTAARGLEA
ncbi:MAG: LysR family transcriptional regulator [Opitutales bacterium]|nr:LysR family transcriptional regulator [Opitutales bacterium]